MLRQLFNLVKGVLKRPSAGTLHNNRRPMNAVRGSLTAALDRMLVPRQGGNKYASLTFKDQGKRERERRRKRIEKGQLIAYAPFSGDINGEISNQEG